MNIIEYTTGANNDTEVGTDAYLDTGVRLIDNVRRDRVAQAFFSVDKFYAADFEATYGFVPCGMPQARQRHGGGPAGEGVFLPR